jgi:predicted amidohydrolase
MREALRVAVAQPLCVPYDVTQNAVAHAAAVRAAAARVVVFPELSLTGYELGAPTLTAADPRLCPLAEACAETGSVALAGAPVPGEGGRPHIAMLAVDGSGIGVAYRKLWLGEAEAGRFAPGDKPAVLEVDGWRLGLAICKDVSVPQHQVDTTALGVDAYVAGTVMSADERDLQDGRASGIAARYGMWVAIASFAGATGGGYTECAGRSGLWSADGALAAQAGAEPGAMVSALLG